MKPASSSVTDNSRLLHIRFVTLNIRYATESPLPGEEPWTARCPRLCAQLRFITSGQSSAFVCLQETLQSQLTDIQTFLGPSWSYIGQGREDGKRAGEYSPIFFRADCWECERRKTYWLSQTPDLPSKGWDAALERIVTIGLFRHKETKTAVVFMSTHLDHQGEIAREESARLLLKLARAWPGDSHVPVFLGGDFNSKPSGGAYKILTSPSSGMVDISDIVQDGAKYGNGEITYTSFGEPDEEPKRIDFLFVQNRESLNFLTYSILSNRFDDMIYLSDHRPVVADVEVPV